MADPRASLAIVPGEYSNEERRLLISLARTAIEAGLRGERTSAQAPNPHLEQKRGAFTTLHLDGMMRGCIGYVLPMYSLVQTVVETAVAAAFQDPRFAPVTAEEVPRLELDISVLSVPKPIAAEDVIVGQHGLMMSMGDRRGLLLPQVPLEYGWDRETFLSQACIKAGLPPDAWCRGAIIEGFTAEVFGDTNI